MLLRLFGLLFLAAIAIAVDFEEWQYEKDVLEAATRAAIDAGKKRYKQMQDSIGSGTDKPTKPWCDIDRDWKVEADESFFGTAKDVGGSRFEDFIKAAKLPISTSDKNFAKIKQSFPKDKRVTTGDPNTAVYEQGYSVKDGSVAVTDINRQDGAGDDIATITWATWAKVVEENGGKESDLKSLVHYTCQNPGAKSVAGDIFAEAETLFGTEPRVFTFEPGDQEKSEPFYALLGIPNGTGAKNILIDHQQALGKKQLKSIVAWDDGSGLMGVSYQFS